MDVSLLWAPANDSEQHKIGNDNSCCRQCQSFKHAWAAVGAAVGITSCLHLLLSTPANPLAVLTPPCVPLHTHVLHMTCAQIDPPTSDAVH